METIAIILWGFGGISCLVTMIATHSFVLALEIGIKFFFFGFMFWSIAQVKKEVSGVGYEMSKMKSEVYHLTEQLKNMNSADGAQIIPQEWVCSKCGSHNKSNAINCHDCGNYK